jgi:hypothetical protein
MQNIVDADASTRSMRVPILDRSFIKFLELIMAAVSEPKGNILHLKVLKVADLEITCGGFQ